MKIDFVAGQIITHVHVEAREQVFAQVHDQVIDQVNFRVIGRVIDLVHARFRDSGSNQEKAL